jgi:hypothetical protein
MLIQKFPSRLENQVDVISRIVDEISENDCKALENVLCKVELDYLVGLAVNLLIVDNLNKYFHPITYRAV